MASAPAREAELAAWWAAEGAVGRDFVAASGERVRVLFAGRAGGSAGPDFRDAVIAIDGARRVGDVELHVSVAGWRGHGHDRDPRYDGVALHVVVGGKIPPGGVTPLASGAVAPIVPLGGGWRALSKAADSPVWPCQRHRHDEGEIVAWLACAGMARFEERVARWRAAFGAGLPEQAVGALLVRAVAEAVGYGRDPAATRVACAGEAARLDALSARRVAALARAPWVEAGDLAARCCGAALGGGLALGWSRLVALFAPAVGPQRAAIIVWNAVLPCLAAYGASCGNRALGRVARAVALSAPGLPANAVTRSMTRWLGLRRAPSGALAQQGLHHLHARWCRAKACDACPLGG